MSARRLARPASIAFFGVLPALLLVMLAFPARGDDVAFDFRPYYSAAGAIIHGDSPYPAADDPLTARSGAYVYPPLIGIAAIPFRLLPEQAAGYGAMALLALLVPATLLVLGVRDWRCYGIAFLWPPVLSAIQTGNVTLVLAFCAALMWRFRDRPLAGSLSLGIALALKLFLWPLAFWLAATRRVAAAVYACAVGVGILVLSWAAIGFAGLVDYPELMRRLQDSVGPDSYTAYIVALDAGLPSVVARLVWLGLGLGLLAAVVVLGGRRRESPAFVVAIAAALALTPIVWLHYFALLLVVVGVTRSTLGVAWFVPLALVITPGSGHPTPFQTAGTLAIASVTIALSLRSSAKESERIRESQVLPGAVST